MLAAMEPFAQQLAAALNPGKGRAEQGRSRGHPALDHCNCSAQAAPAGQQDWLLGCGLADLLDHPMELLLDHGRPRPHCWTLVRAALP